MLAKRQSDFCHLVGASDREWSWVAAAGAAWQIIELAPIT
jgi:hypothetical protein